MIQAMWDFIKTKAFWNIKSLLFTTIIWFSTSLVNFLIAYGLFMQTDFYKSVTAHGGHAHLQLFFLAATGTGRTVWLICLLFFSFCSASHEKYKHHYLLKSIVEFMVMVLVSLLILGIGHKPHEAVDDVISAPRSSYDGKLRLYDVAGLLTVTRANGILKQYKCTLS